MNMKDLKMYEAPASEVVELEMSQIICASNPDNPFDDSTAETPEIE